MERFKEYKAFWKSLVPVLRRVRPHAAPAHLAEETMRRIMGRPSVPEFSWAPKAAMSLAALAVALTVWGVRVPKPEPGPKILKFTVDKTSVALGEPVTLSWEVANAKKVLIKDNHGLVADPGRETSIIMNHMRPGQYTFVLIAMGTDEDASQELR